MTVLVGVLCRDGIVVGADSSVTFGITPQRPTIEQPTSGKIEIISGSIILAGTGPVGMKQRFAHTIDQLWKANEFKVDGITVARKLSAHAIKDFRDTFAPQGQFGALVAFPVHKNLVLCEFDIANFQPELKTADIWYFSMGSGQPITDPFLAFIRGIFWMDGKPPTCQDGIFATVWAIQHAVEVNPGGINGPVRIATLTLNKKGEPQARILDAGELDEHRDNIIGAKKYLQGYAETLRSKREVPATPIPEPPK